MTLMASTAQTMKLTIANADALLHMELSFFPKPSVCRSRCAYPVEHHRASGSKLTKSKCISDRFWSWIVPEERDITACRAAAERHWKHMLRLSQIPGKP